MDGIVSPWDTSPPDQPALDAAANDAEAIGSTYYTEARVDDAADKVDLYLASAPQSVLDQLQAKHPGTYAIHNTAAHPLSELRRIENAPPAEELQSEGIDIERIAPTPEGYLAVVRRTRLARLSHDSPHCTPSSAVELSASVSLQRVRCSSTTGRLALNSRRVLRRASPTA